MTSSEPCSQQYRRNGLLSFLRRKKPIAVPLTEQRSLSATLERGQRMEAGNILIENVHGRAVVSVGEVAVAVIETVGGVHVLINAFDGRVPTVASSQEPVASESAAQRQPSPVPSPESPVPLVSVGQGQYAASYDGHDWVTRRVLIGGHVVLGAVYYQHEDLVSLIGQRVNIRYSGERADRIIVCRQLSSGVFENICIASAVDMNRSKLTGSSVPGSSVPGSSSVAVPLSPAPCALTPAAAEPALA
jgi:hypothetical protein